MDGKIKDVLSNFAVNGSIVSCTPYGNGHINDTYLVVSDTKRYILQKMNKYVFKKPSEVMENIEKVISYMEKNPQFKDRFMSLVPTKSGRYFFVGEDGEYWRLYDFIEDSICLDRPETKEDFYQSAIAFGNFRSALSNFPAEELHESIPDFHNTPKRYNDFLNAVKEDVCDRAKNAQKEILFVTERSGFYSVLADANREGKLRLCVTHNDTKMNNVMLSAKDRKAICVIDLDTIMPGFSVNDFGDSIRFGASTAAEDEKDLSKVNFDIELFDIYTKGYIEGCGGALTKDEIMLLPEGAKMMTMEVGMRFLADYLQNDVYFKTAYPEHNLVRCRTQFKLVSEMEKNWDKLKSIVAKYAEESEK